MERKFTQTAFLIWSGLLIWAADFLFLYVFAALACARRFAHVHVFGFAIVPFVTALASAAALAATLLVVRRALGRTRAEAAQDEHSQFILFLTIALGALALLAIAWSALPPLVLRTGCS